MQLVRPSERFISLITWLWLSWNLRMISPVPTWLNLEPLSPLTPALSVGKCSPWGFPLKRGLLGSRSGSWESSLTSEELSLSWRCRHQIQGPAGLITQLSQLQQHAVLGSWCLQGIRVLSSSTWHAEKECYDRFPALPSSSCESLKNKRNNSWQSFQPESTARKGVIAFS